MAVEEICVISETKIAGIVNQENRDVGLNQITDI